MRKIMLAATAIAALGLAGAANAQTSVPDATPNFGLPIVPGGAALDAGTVNVFVKGKVYTSMSVGSDSGSSGAGNGGAKLNSVDLMSMMRLYFGFDGKSNQGLGYGANVEVRQFYDGQYANGSAADPLQVRREFVYFGTDAAGKVRMGTVDGPFGLMEVGNFAWAPYDVMTGFLGDQNAYGRTKATLLNWSWGGNSLTSAPASSRTSSPAPAIAPLVCLLVQWLLRLMPLLVPTTAPLSAIRQPRLLRPWASMATARTRLKRLLATRARLVRWLWPSNSAPGSLAL